jgi:phage terminase small subunit
LKVLRGNPSKTRLNEDEPTPPAGEVVKPEVLSVDAALVWDELAPICLAMRTLTSADLRPFAKLCELEATFTANTRNKGTEAFDVRLERETAATLRPYYDLFGLNPIARAKIVVPKEEAPQSKWAGVLK